MRKLADNHPTHRGSIGAIILWAAIIGLLLSTEFLAQPFVWRDWPLTDVLEGWLHIALDRLLVTGAIAVCVVGVRSLPVSGRRLRLGILMAAIISGSALGEALQYYLDPFSGHFDAGNFGAHVLRWSVIGLAVVGILASWQLNAGYATQAAETAAAEADARRMLVASELEALRHQIEPHFLFNTLATIKRFGQTGPAEGYLLLDRLFEYISTTLAASQKQESDLGGELDLVRAYLDVCGIRMGPRLTIIEEIDPALRACRFPPLMLGTLVENALRHGLAPLPSGGTITLGAQRQGSVLEVRVCDDGIGLMEEGGSGIGLANLSARLKLLYGSCATLRLEAVSPRGVCASLRIPYALAS